MAVRSSKQRARSLVARCVIFTVAAMLGLLVAYSASLRVKIESYDKIDTDVVVEKKRKPDKTVWTLSSTEVDMTSSSLPEWSLEKELAVHRKYLPEEMQDWGLFAPGFSEADPYASMGKKATKTVVRKYDGATLTASSQEHAEYWGEVVGMWGSQQKVDTADACEAMCLEYVPKAHVWEGAPCNTWVYNPESRECWTKYASTPNMPQGEYLCEAPCQKLFQS